MANLELVLTAIEAEPPLRSPMYTMLVGLSRLPLNIIEPHLSRIISAALDASRSRPNVIILSSAFSFLNQLPLSMLLHHASTIRPLLQPLTSDPHEGETALNILSRIA